MEQKYQYAIAAAVLIVGIAIGYTVGVQQTLKLVGTRLPPGAYQSEGAPQGTVPGYKNPFSVYKNPFR